MLDDILQGHTNEDELNTVETDTIEVSHAPAETSKFRPNQGCGNTMPDLSNLVPFHSGQVENFNLLVPGQVQNLS